MLERKGIIVLLAFFVILPVFAQIAEESAASPSAPNEAVPNEAVPNEAVPNEAVPNEAVPNEAVPNEAVPNEAVPNEAVPNEAVDADLGSLLPDDNAIGPIANTGAVYKFDDGFYQKVQDLIATEPIEGQYGVYDGTRYYDVIIVVSRDDDDDRDPDEVSRENRNSIVERLELLGAKNILAAESLSFVTASIPVADIPGVSDFDEAYQLGDGETVVSYTVDTARQTIHATSSDIRSAIGRSLSGSGVVVAVMDSGINHTTALNPKVLKRVQCSNTGCEPVLASSVTGHFIGNDYLNTSHGTQVAQVIAASGLSQHNGIATGVKLLDIKGNDSDATSTTTVAHGLDWSLQNGADIINMSFGYENCNDRVSNLIINEAVDKGVIVVASVGNNGFTQDGDNTVYSSVTGYACSYNSIAVGGVNDRADDLTMYYKSGRGPTTENPRLKPEIVAPAENIILLNSTSTGTPTILNSGTSFATPQVSAASALMLDLRPDLTPAEVKAGLLLGADWKGPIPCTSSDYERNSPNSNCSYARQPTDSNSMSGIASNNASTGILNNVGFGLLNVSKTLDYIDQNASRNPASHNYVMSDFLSAQTQSKKYSFTVTDTSNPVKVILTWLVHPHGGVIDQPARDDQVHLTNLNFVIKNSSNQVIQRAQSLHQSNEFAVFMPPATGTYTITVSSSDSRHSQNHDLGIDELNKPVQNFALASTHSLSLVPNTTNSSPTAQARTVLIAPNQSDPTIVLLRGTDPNNDSITFNVSSDPTHGTVSTDEFITKTTSRLVYTPNNPALPVLDTFTIVPKDGLVTGRSATMTIQPEMLPTGASIVTTSSAGVKQWHEVKVTHISPKSAFVERTESFPIVDYPVSAIFVESANMEGVDLTIRDNTGTEYSMVIPPSGARTIQFDFPIQIVGATLSADSVDEEIPYLLARAGLDRNTENMNINMRVGYVPSSSCTSCSTSEYDVISSPSIAIPAHTGTTPIQDTIRIPTHGTISSLSVAIDLRHTWIGDLRIELISPNNTKIPLHSNTGGSRDNIIAAFTPQNSRLINLTNSEIHGDWTLSIHDTLHGIGGTLNEWAIKADYTPTTYSTVISPPKTTIFLDDFEFGLSKWIESGEGDWRILTSSSQSVPIVPSHSSSNKVLHSDDCDTSCTMTSRVIDLSGYSSANLSFWRFVDSSLENGEYLKVEAYDGSAWSTLKEWSSSNGGNDGEWNKDPPISLSSYLSSDFKMRFVTTQSHSTEDIQIDDVLITGTRLTPPATLVQTTVSEDFESGLTNWTLTGDSDWSTRLASVPLPSGSSSNKVAFASNCDTQCVMTLGPVDLSSRSSGYLVFDRFIAREMNIDDYLKVELYDGTSWTTAFDWQPSFGHDDNIWHTESYNLSAHLVPNMKIKITAKSSASDEVTMIDNISIMNTSPNPTPTTISEDFESGLNDWILGGDSSWIVRSSIPSPPSSSSPNKAAYASDCDPLCIMTLGPVDLSGRTVGYLSLDRYMNDEYDYDEYLKVELYDGSNWTTAFNWQASDGDDDNTWHTESFDLSAHLVSNMEIRITTKSSKPNEIAMIDNISISDTSTSTTPTSNHSVYVADTDDRQVLAFSTDGTYQGEFISVGSGGLGRVWDVAFGPDNHLYASDFTYDKIRKYNGSTGALIDANWASISSPYGLTWNDDTLYVATGSGVHRYSLSGTPLGVFGDTDGGSSAPNTYSIYDVSFCNNNLFLIDRSTNKMHYYSSSGTHLGTISSSQFNTSSPGGLACGNSLSGSATRLYFSAGDPGSIREINPTTRSVTQSYTSMIDEPYGMDLDSSSLYVVNKDDDNITKVTSSSSSSFGQSNRLDDPRGVAIGPMYSLDSSGSSGASGSSDMSFILENDEPTFDITLDGTSISTTIEISSLKNLNVLATDPDGDAISISIPHTTLPDGTISITDNSDGTATITLDPTGVASETYVFWLRVSDIYDNFVPAPYLVTIS